MENKHDTISLSKADKETKRKANSFKRDPLTQTKLQGFFKKDSSPSSKAEESDDENDLVIDENTGDATLKLNERTEANNNITSNHNDTKLKLDDITDDAESSNKYKSKTLVINITLQGIPNKDKEPDSDSDTANLNDNKMKSPKKTTAKRKIKALFGESSESDSEIDDKPKKKKKINNQITGEKKKHAKGDHLKYSDNDKSKQKPKRCGPKQASLFGELSDSDIEKELIIDEKNASAQNTSDGVLKLNNSNDSEKYIRFSPTSNTHLSEFENVSKPDQSSDAPQENGEKKIEVNVSVEKEDVELNKAHKLSIEADKVLQKLKQFAEMPPEPIVVDKIQDVKSPINDLAPVSPNIEKVKDKPLEKLESHNKKLNLSPHKEHRKIEVKVKCETEQIKRTHKSKEISEHKNKEILKYQEKNKSSHKRRIKDNMKEKTKHIKESSPTKKSEKVDVASLVVKLLMPYYKNKKISNRELFKITARHIVHQLLAIKVTGMSLVIGIQYTVIGMYIGA